MLRLALQSVPARSRKDRPCFLVEERALLCWIDNGGDKVLEASGLKSLPALLGQTRRAWLDRNPYSFPERLPLFTSASDAVSSPRTG
jgi:hypothetical protein